MDNPLLSPSELQFQELTWREQDILSLLADRLSDKEIGELLHLAVSTVKWYNRQIFAKLGVANRKMAVEPARGLLRRCLVATLARDSVGCLRDLRSSRPLHTIRPDGSHADSTPRNGSECRTGGVARVGSRCASKWWNCVASDAYQLNIGQPH